MTVWLYIIVPKGFFPVQDTGVLQGISVAAETASFGAMAQHQQELADAILKDPDVVSLSSFIGVDGTNMTLNTGRFLINLKPKDDRALSATQIAQRLQQETANVPGVQLYLQPVQDLTLDASVSRTQYQFVLENPNLSAFNEWVPKLLAQMRKSPDLTDVASDLEQQALDVDLVINRQSAARYGITPATVDNALYDMFGQRIISTIYTQSNQYRVIMEAEPSLQTSLNALNTIYLPSSASTTGQVPLSAIVAVEQKPGPLHDQPSRAVPGDDDFLRYAAGLIARRRGDRDPPGGEGHPPAQQLHHRLPGRRRGAGGLAVERTVAGAGGDPHRLHRARRAVRELHPPDHHPVHAALGRRRSAGGAADRRRQHRRDLDHRHHPADRHREEERAS